MINKLVKSISGVLNKWGKSDTEERFFYFVLGCCSTYAAVNLILLIQFLWVTL
jgi:hypothetical protein